MAFIENNRIKIVLDTGAETTTAKEVWKNCLSTIKKNVSELEYRTWFKPIEAYDIIGNTLKIRIPKNLSWDFIEQHYGSLLKKTLLSTLGPDARLTYEIFEEETTPEIQFEEIIPEKNNVVKKVKEEIVPDNSFETFLIKEFNFDSFIEGDGNRLARAAAIAIANSPGTTNYNPFFVYGGVGLGKTHLVQAIGNFAIANRKVRKAYYTTSQRFLTDFVESIQNGTASKFSNFYKDIDILIIDDIQFLSGKESTADIFFHIFNSLHQLGKQIVLTSDKPPKNLVGLDDRLISRFQWGLTVDIQPPDLETRMAILQNKSIRFGLELNSQIIEYIALNVTYNIRELEACLIRLSALYSLEKREIDLDLTKEVVRSIATHRKPKLTIEQIQNVVAEYFHIPPTALIEKTKKQEIVFARQVAMYFCKKLTNSTLKNIGLYFGGRDHSTVIHAISSIEENFNDPKFLNIIRDIQKKIEFSI